MDNPGCIFVLNYESKHRDFINFDLNDFENYINFELNSAIFKVNDKIVRQIKGLPIS